MKYALLFACAIAIFVAAGCAPAPTTPAKFQVGDTVAFSANPAIDAVITGRLFTYGNWVYEIRYFDRNGRRRRAWVDEIELQQGGLS